MQSLRLLPLAGVLLLTACSHSPKAVAVQTENDWHEFEGTWTAAGNRHILRLGNDRQTSVANYQGTLLLAGPGRPGVGFRAEVIALNDSDTGMLGRAVWTDEHGDQVWSELRGEGNKTTNKIVGTFVGGTGRYSGATATYDLSWIFMLDTNNGTSQRESLGLKGRVRKGSST